MIPNRPYDTHSDAEKKVFDRLKQAFPKLRDDYVALHSVDISMHPTKRFAEIDFLICCTYGVFVLEVKGGHVSRQDGFWQYRNKQGKVDKHHQSPFKQADTALQGVRKQINTHFGKDFLQSVCLGYGVILPDSALDIEAMEWDKNMLCDKSKYRDLEGWLKRFFVYWIERNKAAGMPVTRLSPEKVQQLVSYIRPDFIATSATIDNDASGFNATALHVDNHSSHVESHGHTSAHTDSIKPISISHNGELFNLNLQQTQCLTGAVQHTRILCQGQTGTGKTLLADLIAERWSAQNQKVAIVCQSESWANYRCQQVTIHDIGFASLASLNSSIKRQDIDNYDALIIDIPTQDLTEQVFETLNNSVKNGVAKGQWCLFLNTSSTDEPLTAGAQNILNTLDSYANHNALLTTSYRTPKIREIAAFNRDLISEQIVGQIDYLIQQQLTPQQITIVTDQEMTRELYTRLQLQNIQCLIFRLLDAYSLAHFPVPQISIVSVKDFYGFKNEAIIFVGINQHSTYYQQQLAAATYSAKQFLTIINMA